MSILAIIGHWLTKNFEYKEALLKFIEIEGPKSRKNIRGIVLDLLCELDIRVNSYQLLVIVYQTTSP